MNGLMAPSTKRRNVLARTCALVFFLVVLGLLNPYDKTAANRLLGGTLGVLALLPLGEWLAKRDERDIPLLAMHGVFYAVCFGFAGFITIHSSLLGGIPVTEAEYTTALLAGLVSWICVLAGYTIGKRLELRLALRLIQASSVQSAATPVLLYPPVFVLFVVAGSTGQADWVQILGAIRIFLFVWAIHAAWSRSLPTGYSRVALGVYVPAECLLFGGVSGGVLVGLLIYGQLLGITYAATRRRIPIVVTLLTILLFGVLTTVKNDYRLATRGVNGQHLGPVLGTQLFFGLAWDYVSHGDVKTTVVDTFEMSYARLDHLHTVAAVMADTPNSQPYRHGETLLPLLTKWIPRFLWAEKPREELGNRWARDYGYLGPDDDETSYNLPWLAEMYINFGWGGIVSFSVAVGVLMGVLWAWLINGRTESRHFALALTVSSAFFFPESNMSLQLGGVVVAGASVLSLLVFLRHFSGEARSWRGAATRPTVLSQR
jgi:hypothetical protein